MIKEEKMKREEWEKLKERYEGAKKQSIASREIRLLNEFNYFVKKHHWLDTAKEKLEQLKGYIKD